jgi:fumarate hydratase, class II
MTSEARTHMRIETDSLGEVLVPADRYWGAQTERSLEYFSIGEDLIPHEMVTSYGILKKAAAMANRDLGVLPEEKSRVIILAADEVIEGKLRDHFPLHVWMSGSGTQLNMNVNEVISNRAIEMAGGTMGSKIPIHPNDHVNMSQSTNDTFPSVMCMAAALQTRERLIPAVKKMRDALDEKAGEWKEIIKIGRTHMQDATPLTLGQEFSGYVGMLDDNCARIEYALQDVYKLALGGTAVGTGMNAHRDFPQIAIRHISQLTGLPFSPAPNKFAVQGAHDGLVSLSGTFKTLASSLYKIANDIRLLSSGPRCGFSELVLPVNEPGSSIMPGKANPTQCEAMSMVAVQVMGYDTANSFAGAGGHLEMNVYKPLIMFNLIQSIRILSDSCINFTDFLIVTMKPNIPQIHYFLNRSLMLVTALSPKIGYDKASEVAHHALDNDLTLKEAALALGYVSEEEFDEIVDPRKMI